MKCVNQELFDVQKELLKYTDNFGGLFDELSTELKLRIRFKSILTELNKLMIDLRKKMYFKDTFLEQVKAPKQIKRFYLYFANYSELERINNNCCNPIFVLGNYLFVYEQFSAIFEDKLILRLYSDLLSGSRENLTMDYPLTSNKKIKTIKYYLNENNYLQLEKAFNIIFNTKFRNIIAHYDLDVSGTNIIYYIKNKEYKLDITIVSKYSDIIALFHQIILLSMINNRLKYK